MRVLLAFEGRYVLGLLVLLYVIMGGWMHLGGVGNGAGQALRCYT